MLLIGSIRPFAYHPDKDNQLDPDAKERERGRKSGASRLRERPGGPGPGEDTEMAGRCRCGHELEHAFDDFSCQECGVACCAVCAIPLESVTYCRSCARLLLGTTAVRASSAFNLCS